MNEKEYETLKRACAALEDGPDYRMTSYALNLINTVTDFMLNGDVVDRAAEYFRRRFGDALSHEGLKAEVDKFANTEEGNKQLAQHLWGYDLWTRAKFLRVILDGFEARGIRDQHSLERWVRGAIFERDVKGRFKSEHHSIGTALFHWLCLRCGIDTIKPDVHVLRFVSQAIGRKATQVEAVRALSQIAQEQGRKASLLDAAIYHKQTGRALPPTRPSKP